MTLRQGSVYLRKDRGLTSALSHYFVVVSRENGPGRDIYFVVITSQVEKRRRIAKLIGRSEGSLVDIPVGSHQSLTKPSLIDCNDVFVRNEAEVHMDLTANGAGIQPMSAELMEKILDGVRASGLPENVKKEILND